MRFFLFFLIFQSLLTAQEEQRKVDEAHSFIRYEGTHVLHDWEGTNSKIKGIAVFDTITKELTKIALLAKISDFDSNNSGRDAHSLEVLEALRFPEIKFYSDQIRTDSDSLNITGILEFHDVPLNQMIKASLLESSDGLELVGEFELTPTRYEINLPSFLGVKMKDFLKIEFRIVIEE
jgi:polyisoprenoid-binding protein YceI